MIASTGQMRPVMLPQTAQTLSLSLSSLSFLAFLVLQTPTRPPVPVSLLESPSFFVSTYVHMPHDTKSLAASHVWHLALSAVSDRSACPVRTRDYKVSKLSFTSYMPSSCLFALCHNKWRTCGTALRTSGERGDSTATRTGHRTLTCPNRGGGLHAAHHPYGTMHACTYLPCVDLGHMCMPVAS